MQEVNVGIVGLGNVGMGTFTILTENADQIALKLGFQLRVTAICSPSIRSKQLPAGSDSIFQTPDWRELVAHPEVDIVAELVGGTSVAREISDAAIEHGNAEGTANKDWMALCSTTNWEAAMGAGVKLQTEGTVASR